jgi:short-subunit dehydrogenase
MPTALVTGASSGMGKATGKKLLEKGHTVYVAARRVDQMRDLEELGAIVLAMDITKAGFGLYGAVEDNPIHDARYQFEVNLFGLASVTQLALPYMRSRRAGKIVNISSVGGKVCMPSARGTTPANSR